MMRATVIIQNLKCNDCKQKVFTVLEKFNGISNFNITNGRLSFCYASHNAIEGLRYYLSKIGHPIIEDTKVMKKNLTKKLIAEI